jgi:hypothetical protein
MSHESAVEEMRRSWAQREEGRRQRDEAEAERRAAFEAAGESERRALQEYTDQLRGRRLSEEELKEQAARRTAESKTATEANRQRAAYRRRLEDQLSAADREVEEQVRRARRDGLSDDELEQFITARMRADALRNLSNRLARLDDERAEAYRRQVTGNPLFSRV